LHALGSEPCPLRLYVAYGSTGSPPYPSSTESPGRCPSLIA
jgi:hypothetical protein